MALVNLNTPLIHGSEIALKQFASVRSNPRLDANPTRAAWMIQFTKAGSVSEIELYVASFSNAQSIDLSIQTIGSDGYPSGSAIANGTADAISSPAIGWNVWSFSTPPTINAGCFYAVVIEWTATQGDVTFNSGGFIVAAGQPYLVGFNGASWTSQDNSSSPMIRVKYDDDSYPLLMGTSSCRQGELTNVSSIAAVKEIGARFRVPFPCRLAGVQSGIFDFNSNINLPTFEFYADGEAPGDGTEVLQVGDQGAGEDDVETNASGASHKYWFNSPQVLAKDTWYKLTINPTGSAIQFWNWYWDLEAQKEQMGLIDFNLVRTENDSTWIEDADKSPSFALLIDQIDDGSGGGGASPASIVWSS